MPGKPNARVWLAWLPIAAATVSFPCCRSEGSSTTRAGSPVQSAPVVLEANDSKLAYPLPSTQRAMDLAHRAPDSGLSILAPIALREDSRLEADVLSARDMTGATLEAEWKASEWPGPSNAAESDRERLDELRQATRWLLRIDLASSGRMRVTLRGRGFALETGTELRARIDLLGHFLVWPSQTQYRPLAPGSMRQLFQDGRADVAQLVPVQTKPAGTGHLLEWDTERTTASTAFGQMSIERAVGLNTGLGGRLVCRWLVEFINGDPSAELCLEDALALRAVFDFPTGGKGDFVVTRVIRKQEFSASSIGVPPAGATVIHNQLPRGSQVSGRSLAGIRSRAMPLGPGKPISAGVGLLATNHALGLRALIVDGVVAGWLWPGEERSIPELLPGVYAVAWRDFMGMSRETPTNVTLPAHISLAASP